MNTLTRPSDRSGCSASQLHGRTVAVGRVNFAPVLLTRNKEPLSRPVLRKQCAGECGAFNPISRNKAQASIRCNASDETVDTSCPMPGLAGVAGMNGRHSRAAAPEQAAGWPPIRPASVNILGNDGRGYVLKPGNKPSGGACVKVGPQGLVKSHVEPSRKPSPSLPLPCSTEKVEAANHSTPEPLVTTGVRRIPPRFHVRGGQIRQSSRKAVGISVAGPTHAFSGTDGLAHAQAPFRSGRTMAVERVNFMRAGIAEEASCNGVMQKPSHVAASTGGSTPPLAPTLLVKTDMDVPAGNRCPALHGRWAESLAASINLSGSPDAIRPMSASCRGGVAGQPVVYVEPPAQPCCTGVIAGAAGHFTGAHTRRVSEAEPQHYW